jgi:hypothetical protein
MGRNALKKTTVSFVSLITLVLHNYLHTTDTECIPAYTHVTFCDIKLLQNKTLVIWYVLYSMPERSTLFVEHWVDKNPLKLFPRTLFTELIKVLWNYFHVHYSLTSWWVKWILHIVMLIAIVTGLSTVSRHCPEHRMCKSWLIRDFVFFMLLANHTEIIDGSYLFHIEQS